MFAQAPDAGTGPAPHSVSAQTLAAGVPIFVRTSRTAKLSRGAVVEGVLTEPVYLYDRLLLPAGSVVHGVVSGTPPLHGMERAKALLNGDVTPLKTAVVRFDRVQTPAGDAVLIAEGAERDVKPVRFVASGKRPSVVTQAKTAAHEKFDSTRAAVFGPGKKDRVLRLLYSQLPYHPQRIWAGTTFVADLTQPADFAGDGSPRRELATQDAAALQNVHVMARLTGGVSSDASLKGDAVDAIVTQPVFDAQHRIVLPEGSHLTGRVVQSKRSRSFGRNGQLRFLFQQVERPGESSQKAYGLVQGAEGAGAANLSVDSEGGVKANPEQNRFVAPLLLAALTAAGHDRDRDGGRDGGLGRQTVASNGFGLVARVVALTVNDANVATGFGAFAFSKSVYFRFIARGQPVAFAADTPLEVQLQTR